MVHNTRASVKALVALLAAAAVVVAVTIISSNSPARAAADGGATTTAPAAPAGSASASTAPPAGTYEDTVNGVDITTDGTSMTSFSVDCRVSGQVLGIVEADDMRMPTTGSPLAFDGMMTINEPYMHPQAEFKLDARMADGGITGTVTTPSNSPVRCDPVQFTASPTPAT